MADPAGPGSNPRAKERWPLLIGALAVAVILGVTLLRTTGTTAPGVTSVRADDAREPMQHETRPHPSRPRTQPPLAERRESRRAAQAEQVRRGRDLHQALAARFAAEPVDAAWASAKEAKLLAASISDEIRRANAVPKNYRASCRSSICRIGADFDNRGSMEDWLTLFSTGIGGELPSEAYVVDQNADGSFHLEIMGLARH